MPGDHLGASRLLPLLAVLILIFAACDPSGAVVVQNEGNASVFVDVLRPDGATDTFTVTPGARVTVGGNAVSGPPVTEVKVFDSACRVLFVHNFQSDPFPNGGLVTVMADSATFAPDELSGDVPPSAGASRLCP